MILLAAATRVSALALVTRKKVTNNDDVPDVMMWIWSVVGILLIVLLIVVIVKVLKK